MGRNKLQQVGVRSGKALAVLGMVAVLTLVFASCNRHKDIYYKLSTEDKSYFDFGVGSWWVYVNDSTGEMDTVRLVSSKHEDLITEYEQENYTEHTEILEIDYSSRAFPDGLLLFMGAGSQCTGAGLTYKNQHGNFSIYRKGPYGDPCTYHGYYTLRSIGDTSIRGAIYPSVYSTTDRLFDLPTDSSHAPTSFVSPSVGVVHYHIGKTDTTWSLVSFSIR